MARRDHPVVLRRTVSRSLYDERRALVGWGIGVAATVLIELALYPTVRSNDMSQLLASYPEAVKQLFGLTDFATGRGYVRAELFSLVLPLLVVIPGILWGSDALAGEEERRTIDLLLANPVSRRQVLMEKAAGVVAGLVAIGLVMFGALVLGDVAFDVGIGPADLAAATSAAVALAGVLAMLALALGAATGRRGLARGVAAAVAVAANLLSAMAVLVGWLEPWRVVSPWYHALGVDPLAQGVAPLHLAVLVAMAAALLAWAAWAFDRRDLAT